LIAATGAVDAAELAVSITRLGASREIGTASDLEMIEQRYPRGRISVGAKRKGREIG
jgi:hypothetical protein